MAVWAIGDLQGCYGPTQRLLEKIRFDPAQDRRAAERLAEALERDHAEKNASVRT